MTFKERAPFFLYHPRRLAERAGDPTGSEKDVPLRTARDHGQFYHPFEPDGPELPPARPRWTPPIRQAMEEKGIGKYMAVKRRDQGGKDGVMGWETIETAEKGSGGFQRIQWQCYDGQDNYYL